ESDTVALNAADGKLDWNSSAAAGAGAEGGRGRGGRDYKAASPIVDGQTIILAGQGVKAIKLEKEGDQIVAKELWNNPGKSVIFNTPVLKNGFLYGLTPSNELFAIDTKDPQGGWSVPFPTSDAASTGAEGAGGTRGRGGRGGGGFGSIVDVGPAL